LNFSFLERFSKNTQISNFAEIHPVGADLFHAGGLTDMQLIFASRDFANTPKSWPQSSNSQGRSIASKQINTVTVFAFRSPECS